MPMGSLQIGERAVAQMDFIEKRSKVKCCGKCVMYWGFCTMFVVAIVFAFNLVNLVHKVTLDRHVHLEKENLSEMNR